MRRGVGQAGMQVALQVKVRTWLRRFRQTPPIRYGGPSGLRDPSRKAEYFAFQMQFVFRSLPSRRVEQRRQRETGKRQRDPRAGRDTTDRGGKALQHHLRIGDDVGGGAPSPTAGAAEVEPRIQVGPFQRDCDTVDG